MSAILFLCRIPFPEVVNLDEARNVLEEDLNSLANQGLTSRITEIQDFENKNLKFTDFLLPPKSYFIQFNLP